MFVFHIPTDWGKYDLIAQFGRFGNVVSARVMTDRENKRSRGFGFVGFDNP